jgi:hypothetical protein
LKHEISTKTQRKQREFLAMHEGFKQEELVF